MSVTEFCSIKFFWRQESRRICIHGFYIPIYFLLLLTISCHNKSEKTCNCKLEKDLIASNPNLNRLEVSTDSLIIIKDVGKDSLNIGEYVFGRNDCLISYRFYNSKETFSFEEIYNSEGQPISNIGNPLVYRLISEINGIDSMDCSLYFYSLNKKYNDPKININGNLLNNVKLKDDSIYANMKIAKFGFNYTNLDSIFIVIKYNFLDECTSRNTEVMDTINMGVKR
jgi:hypothetical protein